MREPTRESPSPAASFEQEKRLVRRAVLGLLLVTIFTHIAFTGGRVGLSLFAIQLKANPLLVGAMVSLLSILPMLFSVHVGRWTDRQGFWRPGVLGTGMAALGSLLPWVWPHITALRMASMLLGSGFMLLHIAANNAVGRVATDATRTLAFGWVALGYSVSSVTGPVLAGLSIDLLGHARAFLVLAAFPVLPLTGLLLAGVQRDPVPARTVADGPITAMRVSDLLGDTRLRSVLAASTAISVTWDCFIFMAPVYGSSVKLSASEIGLIMGSFGMATFAIRVLLPIVIRYLGEWQVLATSLVVAAVTYALMPLTGVLAVLVALAFLLGLGLGGAQPMVLSLLHIAAPAGRQGEAIGLRTTMLNASQVFMPLLLGALSAAAGLALAFWAVAMLASWSAWFAWRQSRSALPAQSD